MLDRMDELILKTLKSSKTPMTAYKIANRLKISRPTATKHCMSLMLEGKVDRDVSTSISGKKTFWRVK